MSSGPVLGEPKMQWATLRLAATGPVTGARFAGLDRYGRDLARLVIAGQDVAVFEGRNQGVWQVRFGTRLRGKVL